ncbi:MAG: carbamate kinase [Deltaproteobacteria bacterium]|nr:carbamate kinase [Deltaproteobacteria bacterium]
MAEKILVALGGNAMIKSGQRGTIQEQAANLQGSLAGVVDLIRSGHRIVITHGNGPQVGHILIRAEEGRGKAYDLPLDVCVAQSQGEIGYLIRQSLQELLRQNGIVREIAAIMTCTVVDRNDPRMKIPSKPVGPFYAREQAESLRARGFDIIEDAHRGYRHVVPSPLPQRILETEIIRRLFEDGVVVIAVGGGGIPVSIEQDGSLAGVEAVVDKDLASSLLASAIGVEKILDLTAVERVKLNFGLPDEQDLPRMTVAEAKHYLAEGHFEPGSMAPKIEAAIGFLERGGREVIITLPEKALKAYQGDAGTHIFPD